MERITAKDIITNIDKLDLAVELGKINDVREYLKNEKIKKWISPSSANRLLRRAIRNRDQYMVAELLQLKPPLDIESNIREMSTLWVAITFTHVHIIKMLIRAGANVEKPIGPHAVHDPESRVLHYFIWNSEINPVREELIDLVLKYGANINAKDSRGFTPLHYAVSLSDVRIAAYLIRKGAKLNIQNIKGELPLHIACEYYVKEEMVTLLVKNGADVFARTYDGYNCLHYLARAYTECPEAAEVLLKRLAPLYEADYTNFYTPLQYSVKSGKEKLTKLFIEYLEENIPHGDTLNTEQLPLLLAAKGESTSIVEMMLTRGANIEQRSKRGKTPLHIACFNSSEKVIAVLLEYGADINALDDFKETPFSLMKYKTFLNPSLRAIIRTFAKYKAINRPINEMDFSVIKKYPRVQAYYEQCTKEIEEMKKHKLLENVTYFSVFSKSLLDMASNLRDRRLIFPLKTKRVRLLFPWYAEDLYHIENKLNSVFYGSVPDTIIREILKSLVPSYLHT